MKKISSYLLAIAMMMLSCSVSAATDTQLEANKKTVVAFYEDAINQRNFEAALKYIGKRYTQHNPLAADGTEGLKNYLQYMRDNFPLAHSEIKKVFAEGDYVVLHVHSKLVPDSRGRAIVDIFKLEGGKVVEHWDVIQEIPEKAANDNGMF